MKANIGAIVIAVIIGSFVIGKSTLFIVNEGQQAIITQFGKPTGEPITTSGIHMKTPFTQEVRFVDKRILYWDGTPNQIPTKDKKYIKVDTTARWKIVNVLKFIQTVQTQRGALARLDSIIDSATRDVISNHNLVEAVRDSNSIIIKVAERRKALAELKAKGERFVEDDTSSEISKIHVGREELSKLIVQKADKELFAFGIQLVDVQLRRISYEKTVEHKVYERMISERQKIAQKIRSIGQGEKAKIEGRLTRDLKRIESRAYRTSQEIRGKAEAKTIAIYARSLSQDPGFYSFTRSMQAYRKSFPDKTKFLLSSDSEFLKYLKSGR